MKIGVLIIVVLFLLSCGGSKVEKKDEKIKEKEVVKETVKEVEVKKDEPKVEEKDAMDIFVNTMSKYQSDLSKGEVAHIEYIKSLIPIKTNSDKIPEINFNIGTFYFQLENYEEAYKYYMDLLKINPYEPALINLTYVAYKLNKVNDVLKLYEPIIKKHEDKKTINEELFSNYAMLLILSNKHFEALKEIRSILAFNQVSIPAYRTLAYMYITTKKYSLAEKTINLAISYTKDPIKQAPLYVVKAKLYEIQQESSKMMASYKKALQLDSFNIDANFVLSMLFMKHNAGEQAVVYLENLVKKYPNYVSFRNLYAVSLRMAKKYDKSLEEYEKIIAIAPNYNYVYFNKGILLQKYMSKPEEAIKSFEIYQKSGGKEKVDERIKTCKKMIEDMKAMENSN